MGRLQGKKIGILIESDFYEPEIHYYQHRFAEEGADLHFLDAHVGPVFADLPRARV